MADESSSLFPTGRRIASANLPLGAQLYDNAGTPIIAADFGTRTLKNGGGITVLDFGASELLDGAGVESIDWANRYLLAADGSTVVINWAGGSELALLSNVIIHNNGDVEAGNINATIWDGAQPSLLPTSRQLIANDGSTVALDWSDPANMLIFGSNVTPTSIGILSYLIYSPDFGSNGAVQAVDNKALASTDGLTYFDNSGFHGVGSVIAGTKTATGTATTTFTVTIGVTMANTTYKVTTEGDNALSAAVRYVTNKTTTTFDVVYLAGLTGAVSFDWMVSP